nr:MAG TPA: hypothetical protein [Caudoviricetes sp.]
MGGRGGSSRLPTESYPHVSCGRPDYSSFIVL